MPRGKNYVNRNGGVALQASDKKKASMEACFYGAACTRKDCIYRHDLPATKNKKQSNEPCMSFLAGKCTFSASGCRKRHPGKAEAEQLRKKFATIRCRHGDACQTAGCLYIHPSDDTKNSATPFGEPSHVAFPPLNNGTSSNSGSPNNGNNGNVAPSVSAVPAGSAWKPSAWGPQQPKQPPQVQPQRPAWSAPVPSAQPPTMQQQPPSQQTMQQQQQVAPKVTPPSYAALAASVPATPQNQSQSQSQLKPQPQPASQPKPQQPPQASPSSTTAALNVNAREFIPGNF